MKIKWVLKHLIQVNMIKENNRVIYETGMQTLLLKGPEFYSNNKYRGFCLRGGGGGGFVHMIGGILSTLQNLWGGFCPPFHKLQGVLCPPCKKHEGCFVHLCQNEQGGFCLGGVLSYIRENPLTRELKLRVVGFVLKKLFTHFEILIVSHTPHCVNGHYFIFCLFRQSGILFWSQL